MPVESSRFVVVPAAYVLLLRPGPDGDEVLLHLRQGTGYRDGHWASVAGHVERDESAEAAAVRESYEEVGVVVAETDLDALCTLLRRSSPSPIDQRVDFFFACRTWTHEPRLREPDKAAALDWFPLTDLPAPMVPHEQEVLTRWRDGALPAVLSVGF